MRAGREEAPILLIGQVNPARMREVKERMARQAEYFDALEAREGRVQARTAALDQIGANVSWLTCKDSGSRIEPRELYNFLQTIADVVIQPDLIPSK